MLQGNRKPHKGSFKGQSDVKPVPLSVCVLALQASVDGLLAEKLRLEQQVEELTSEQVQLREQVLLTKATV